MTVGQIKKLCEDLDPGVGVSVKFGTQFNGFIVGAHWPRGNPTHSFQTLLPRNCPGLKSDELPPSLACFLLGASQYAQKMLGQGVTMMKSEW